MYIVYNLYNKELTMRLLNRFPVETRGHVKVASAYFEENCYEFGLVDRVLYAQQLAQAADILGVDIESEKVAEYLGTPREDISLGIKARSYITSGLYDESLQEIEKRAEYEDPVRIMHLLNAFDLNYNLDKSYHRIPDPYKTVFEKVSNLTLERDAVWRGTTDSLSQAKFEEWVRDPKSKQLLQATFTPDLAIELIRNPWQIFTSLPDPHKQVIARLVNDNVVNSLNSSGRSIYDYDGAIKREQLDESPMQKLERLSKNDPVGVTYEGDSYMEALSKVKDSGSKNSLNRVTASVLQSIDKKQEARRKGRI